MTEETNVDRAPVHAVVRQKPCFHCGKMAPVTFDSERLFDLWSSHNRIICDWRARFDGVKERLRWAAIDETDTGAHPQCALQWAISEEGFVKRYPSDGMDFSSV